MSVINFQKKYNLKPDGIVGKETALKIKEVFNLTFEQTSHFLGQLKTESNFKSIRENMNYSWKRLRQVFSKYFPTDSIAKMFNYKPQEIANKVYGGRMGNDNINDGFKYRGVGALQITGEDNIRALAKYLNDESIVENPDLILEKYYFESALWYFNYNKIWKYCDKVTDINITFVSKAINLGSPFAKGTPNHLKERILNSKFYYNLIK